MSRGKEAHISRTGIVANRAALAELGEWNYCLEERDSFLSCPQIRLVTFGILFSCRRLRVQLRGTMCITHVSAHSSVILRISWGGKPSQVADEPQLI